MLAFEPRPGLGRFLRDHKVVAAGLVDGRCGCWGLLGGGWQHEDRPARDRTGRWLCWRVGAKIVVRRCICLGTVSVVSCLCLAALRITTALRPCAAARLPALAQTRAARTRILIRPKLGFWDDDLRGGVRYGNGTVTVR